MTALYNAIIYFGTFIVIGWAGKRVIDRWMARRGEPLFEVRRSTITGRSYSVRESGPPTADWPPLKPSQVPSSPDRNARSSSCG